MKNTFFMLMILILASQLTACGFEIVDTGYRGIETRFGKVQGEPLDEGLHFYNPFTSHIREIHVREQIYETKTSIFTKDTQRTDVLFVANWRIDPTLAGKLFTEIGDIEMIEEKILKPVVLGSIKDSIGQINADDLIGKRERATESARELTKRNLAERGVLLEDIQFTDIDFDDNYEKAVEEKVVATQRAQKAKNETVTIEEQAKQTVMSAKAQAESMRIQSEALSKNQNLVSYEIAKKWDGKLPQYMFGATVPMINLKELQENK